MAQRRGVPYGDPGEEPPARMQAQPAGGYFRGDRAAQQRYYGVKRQIGFKRQFPLRDWSYIPMRRGSQESLAAFGPTYRQANEQQRANRRANMMSGRGLYRGRGGYFGRALGNLFGLGDLGDKLGDAAWSAGKSFLPGVAQNIGDAVFGVTDKMNGRGRYMKGRGQYAVNNLVTDSGATASSVVPAFNPSDLHSIQYSNKEYIRDVYAPPANTVFQLETWDLNPGLPTSFPWLSQLAVNFEEYELVQLAYTFKSTIADFAAASGQVGQVLMCTQYNPDSSPFATKDEMMLYEGGMSCKTTEHMIHGVECDPSKLAGARQKYIRVGHVPPSEDLKNYDLGRTSLAVVNAPTAYAGQQIGELWVSYTVMLRKPKIASGNAYNVRRDVFIAPQVSISGGAVVANQATLLSGARNSLGCEIAIPATVQNTPTGPGTDYLIADNPQTAVAFTEQFRITIPSSYSGVLRMRLLLAGLTTPPAIAVISLAPATISRFKDIPYQQSGFTTREWNHILNTSSDVESPPGTTMLQSDCELHIRVQPPTNGVPNTIAFAIQNNFNPVASTYFWQLEIVQINSFLSVQDNGRNDRYDLVQHFSGQPAIYV